MEQIENTNVNQIRNPERQNTEKRSGMKKTKADDFPILMKKMITQILEAT